MQWSAVEWSGVQWTEWSGGRQPHSTYPSLFSLNSLVFSFVVLVSSTLAMSADSHFGYGQNPRCSELQYAWQTAHPMFKAVIPKRTLKDVLGSNALAMQLTLTRPSSGPVHCAAASLRLSPAKPRLIDYVQLPITLWVPDFFYPDLVPSIKCPGQKLSATTPQGKCGGLLTRRRWHSGGPRVIHGVRSAEYLHCWEYTCNEKDCAAHYCGVG